MGVVVRKSSTVVVRPPPEPMTATVNINLSPLDKNVMSVPAAVFMVFDGRIPEPAATIERAPSQALAHYSPVSGRLAAGAEQGEFHIRCTGEGVPFVAAAADCSGNAGMVDAAAGWAWEAPADGKSRDGSSDAGSGSAGDPMA